LPTAVSPARSSRLPSLNDRWDSGTFPVVLTPFEDFLLADSRPASRRMLCPLAVHPIPSDSWTPKSRMNPGTGDTAWPARPPLLRRRSWPFVRMRSLPMPAAFRRRPRPTLPAAAHRDNRSEGSPEGGLRAIFPPGSPRLSTPGTPPPRWVASLGWAASPSSRVAPPDVFAALARMVV
jgi:hypothetical protein